MINTRGKYDKWTSSEVIDNLFCIEKLAAYATNVECGWIAPLGLINIRNFKTIKKIKPALSFHW